ncbi:ABC transporter ATP-binding protein [Lacticaseibacillus jixiensis]|uniref:ABC transporter ATP-binding protein n=1 Tax=Lacticaseibacillus jixiensis TaxID=3231926 RepID=UPI0036F42EBD
MIELEHITKRYDRDTQAVSDVNLTVKDGEFLVFLGPSGCGKSTILRMISGLEEISAGRLAIDGQDHTHTQPSERGVAMVFQNYALYPHLSVRDNIGFGLRVKHVKRAIIRQKADAIAESLGLTPYLDQYPGNLSGGQMQRVALGRAIASNCKICLMDEPLSNLDARLRVEMRKEISLLHQKLQTTTIYVTHDQVEAMTMADRIAVINQGRIQQIGTPHELYLHPANTFVASFFGTPPMNLLQVPKVAGGFALGRRFLAHAPQLADDTLTVGIRPEAVRLQTSGVAATVKLIEDLGSEQLLHLQVDTQTLIAKTTTRHQLGQAVHFDFTDDALTYFDQAGQRLDPAKEHTS